MMNPLKFAEMMQQATKVRAEVEEQLAHTQVVGSAGGGAVTATMNGKKQLLGIKLDPAAVAALSAGAGDVEMLEDLIVAAVNDAGRRAEESAQSNLQGLLGGLKLPGINA